MMATAREKTIAGNSDAEVTRNNSNENSGDANSGDEHDNPHSVENSTLQSHASALNVHRMQGYEKPKIHLMSHNAA